MQQAIENADALRTHAWGGHFAPLGSYTLVGKAAPPPRNISPEPMDGTSSTPMECNIPSTGGLPSSVAPQLAQKIVGSILGARRCPNFHAVAADGPLDRELLGTEVLHLFLHQCGATSPYTLMHPHNGLCSDPPEWNYGRALFTPIPSQMASTRPFN